MNDAKLLFPVSGIDLEGLSETHQLVRFTPNNDPSLAFSLVLPKNWAMVKELGPQPAGIGDLTKIGLFTETPLGPAAANLQVFMSRVPFEIGLRDWIEYQAETFGTKIISAQEYQFAIGAVIDAGGVYGPPQAQQVVRMVAHSDSGRIFMVVAAVAESRYNVLQKNIAIAVSSFKLLTSSGSDSLEPSLKTTVSNPDFSVSHPASWIAKDVAKRLPGKSGIDLVLMKDQQLMSYLRAKAITDEVAATDSSGSKLKTANEELAEAGVALTANWQKDLDPAINAISDASGLLIAPGTLNGIPIELRFALVHRGPLWFAVILISVLKTSDRILWMRSKRAYEIALATVTPESAETKTQPPASRQKASSDSR
jgi:hypothetical protein